MTKDKFLSQTGSLYNFVPEGDLGAFDIEFDPAHEKMHVTVNYCLKKSDPDAQLHLNRFSRAFKKNVKKHWNKKGKFTCTRDGWNDVVLKPTFEVNATTEDMAHYVIEIQPESDAEHVQGPVAVVRPDAINAKAGFQPRKAEFGAASNLDREVETYHRNILWQLDDGLHIALEVGSTGWQAVSDALGSQRLRRFARNIARFKVPKKFHSSTRPKVKIKGTGPGNRLQLANAARDYLQQVGLKNSFVTSGDGNATDTPGVILKIDRREMLQLFPKNTGGRRSFFKEITTVHEFGHMLGLPDEYLCLANTSRDAMVEVFAIDQNQAATFKALGPATADPAGIVKAHQETFVRKCARAGLAPPSFGIQSSSLMSCGMVIHPVHFVTLWEALTQYSGVGEWKIEAV